MNLLDQSTELYWSFEEYGIDDRRRMKAVLYEIAATIRTWAPRKEEAKICHLAINEIADRIIRECNDSDAKREEAA
jgi:hypothetical protein